MFTIGEFARLASVTPRALRHYEQIGLIRPDSVDDSTGYRYYTASQLPLLNRVVALQRLGFSLKEIESVLEVTTPEQLRGMLTLRKAQVEEELAVQQATLVEIEMRLRAIEREGSMTTLDITIKSLPRQRFVAVAAIVPGFGPANTRQILMESADVLQQALAKTDISPTGNWFICFDRTDADEIEAFFCLPVSDDVHSVPAPAGVFETDPVPQAISLVRTVEDIDRYSEVYQDLAIWAEEHGYLLVGDGRDYSLDGTGEGTGMVMEIQHPVRRPDETAPHIAPRRVNRR